MGFPPYFLVRRRVTSGAAESRQKQQAGRRGTAIAGQYRRKSIAHANNDQDNECRANNPPRGGLDGDADDSLARSKVGHGRQSHLDGTDLSPAGNRC